MIPELFIELVKSLNVLLTELIKSQPPEVQRQLWEWYVQDVKWWRHFLHIDEGLPVAKPGDVQKILDQKLGEKK
jgi:hypothetical protein